MNIDEYKTCYQENPLAFCLVEKVIDNEEINYKIIYGNRGFFESNSLQNIIKNRNKYLICSSFLKKVEEVFLFNKNIVYDELDNAKAFRIICYKDNNDKINCLFNDISDQIKIQEKLKLESEKFQMLVDSIPGGVGEYRVDENMTPLFISDGISKMCNLTREEYLEAVKTNALAVVHPDDKKEAYKAISEAVRSNAIIDYTYRLLQKDGSYKWTKALGRKLQQTDLGYPVISIVFFDISKERQTELDLSSTLDTFDGGLSILKYFNNCFHLSYVTDGFCRMVKTERTSLIGRYGNDVFGGVHPQDLEYAKQLFLNNCYHNAKFNTTFRIAYDKKNFIWVNACAVVKEENGAFLYYINYTDVTHQHIQQLELVKSEEKFRIATTNSDISFWTYDIAKKQIIQTVSSMHLHWCNDIVENVPEALAKSGYIMEESINDFYELHRQVISGVKNPSAEIWFKRVNGDGYWCEKINYTTIFDDEQRAVISYAIGKDITDLKQAEKRYNEFLEKRFVFDKTSIGCFRLNLTTCLCSEKVLQNDLAINDSKVTSLTEIFEKIYSKVIDEKTLIIYKTMFNRNALIQSYYRGEFKVSFEHQYLIDDNIEWIETNCIMMRNPSTNDIEAIIYGVNIDNEKTIKNIINNIIELDYEFMATIEINTEVLTLYGAKNESVLEMPENKCLYSDVCANSIEKYVAKEDIKAYSVTMKMSNIIEELKTKKVFTCAFSFNINGIYYRKQWCYSYLNKKAIFFYRRDITKLFIEEQDSLFAVKKANSAKTEFISQMSHDMRTPMNAIIGLSSLGMEECLDNKANKYFSKINKSADYLLGLINDVLDMSKIESKTIEIIEENYTLRDFLTNITNNVLPVCQKKQIDLNIIHEIDEEENVYIDKLHFNQICINLLSNAIKFTNENGKIDFSIERELINGLYEITVKVSDNGLGMSAEFLNRLYEPFTRETKYHDRPIEGTGLGLSIVYNLVELMGGEISVVSRLHQGTCFTVKVTAKACETQSVKYAFNEQQLINKRVLLCEDHPLNIEISKKLLEKKQMIVDVAMNGEEGLKTFKNSEEGYYDVILMDVRMPVLNGILATKAIRVLNRADAQKVPIIAMTADAFSEDMDKSMECGMNYHLSKPVIPALLYETIAKFLK